MRTAYISLGSNLDPEHHLRAALTGLAARFGEVRCSSWYRSEAVGFDGPAFVNLVASVETELGAGDLVRAFRGIEDECGRDRRQPRFSSRTMDIDLLLLGDLHGDVDGVSLPRDEVAEAAFVLVPLLELAPDLTNPVTGQAYAELLPGMADDVAGLQKMPGAG